MLIETCNINPLDVFRRLYSHPYPFLLDSCGLNRYSYAGAEPFMIVRAKNKKVEIIKGSTITVTENIFSVLTDILNEFKVAKRPLQFPFQGGAVGYFGYELKNQIEKLPEKYEAEPNIPDCILCFYDTVFAYDHRKDMGYILSSGLPVMDDKKKRQRARERLNRFCDIIKSPLPSKGRTAAPLNKILGGDGVKSNFTRDAYINAIRHGKKYISSGDIYQVNLSQRFTIDFNENPLSFYSNLRKINPAQFGAFLNYEDFQIISNSPERLLRVNSGIAETSPIKGTRPRGRNKKEDRGSIKALKTSQKELSEHIMIVDMERNDLGKICDYGTVRAYPLKRICTYPTLHHMVSTVKGKIRKGITAVECIKALFPGGSVTGAPKIRAMEIIEELEPTPRGIYTGGIGYIDFSGDMDVAMAIRTAILKGKHLYLQVGGGIVADSDPEEEYEETILKAMAFFKTIKTMAFNPGS